MAREQKYALDKGGDKRLSIRWQGIWKNVEVLFDGEPLGEPFVNFKALKLGRDFTLPDGRTLHVVYVSGAFKQQGLAVTIDGRPLAGSSSDPREAIKAGAVILYIIAGLSILVGALGMGGVRMLAEMGFGWPSVVAGVVLGVLGYVGAKYRSRIAFAVAGGLVLIDLVLSLAVMVEMHRFPTFAIVMRVFFLIAIFRAMMAVGEAKKVEEQELADSFK